MNKTDFMALLPWSLQSFERRKAIKRRKKCYVRSDKHNGINKAQDEGYKKCYFTYGNRKSLRKKAEVTPMPTGSGSYGTSEEDDQRKSMPAERKQHGSRPQGNGRSGMLMEQAFPRLKSRTGEHQRRQGQRDQGQSTQGL